jgi:hypothetical protein
MIINDTAITNGTSPAISWDEVPAGESAPTALRKFEATVGPFLVTVWELEVGATFNVSVPPAAGLSAYQAVASAWTFTLAEAMAAAEAAACRAMAEVV